MQVKTVDIFFELLKSTLKGEGSGITLKDVSSDTWQELYDMAIVQGVFAILYDGILRVMDADLPRKLKISWIVNSENMEKNYNHRLKVSGEVVSLLSKEEIKVVILKGIAVAQLYPVPSHREWGDLDVWFVGKGEKAESILKANGATMGYGSDKHAVIFYKGMPIEDHHTFLDVETSSVDKILDKRLKEIMDRDGLRDVLIEDRVVAYTPSPTFNAIFLMRHMMVHFINGLAVRHFCDWALFLKHYHKEIDIDCVRDAFSSVNQLELVGAFSQICVTHLGLPVEYNIFEPSNSKKLEAAILDELFRDKGLMPQKYKNPIRRVSVKFHRFQTSIWRRKLINNMSTISAAVAYVKPYLKDFSLLFR